MVLQIVYGVIIRGAVTHQLTHLQGKIAFDMEMTTKRRMC